MTLSLGTPIGHYTVIEHVGAEGTTAEVYRARDERHDRVVALKLLPGTSERSRREAVAVTALDHPNIVATFDVIEHEGRLCLIQEWIDGGSLADELDLAGQLGLTATVQLGRDVASALHYAHQRGILHRDIKPSNVLRTVEGTYKLTDFGAFGQLQVETATTRAGEIAGTPLYMSPEQITGAPQSPASDLFGLGLLLYRCVHGRLPDDMAGSYLQLAYSRTRTPISVPPSPLQGLLQRCLDLDPAQRPGSAADVLTALDQIQCRPSPPPVPTTSPPPVPPNPAGQPDWEPLWDIQRAEQRRDPDRERRLDAQLAERLRLDGARRRYPMRAEQPPDLDRAAAPKYLPRTWALAPWATLVVLSVAVVAAGIVLLGVRNGLVRIGIGLAIAGIAFVVAQQIRRRWTSRAPEAERRAATILFGAGQRDELTRSLMIEVDQVVRNLKSLDAKFLGMTVVAMIHEYEAAKESSERQAALLNVVALMEKLQAHFSPWHVRHKDAIVTCVAVVGALAGVASVVSGFLIR
ncbi:MAG: serine/threonine-protein kinase [Pseudonocardiaceae bacterium]